MGAAIWAATAVICCGWLLIVARAIRDLYRTAPSTENTEGEK